MHGMKGKIEELEAFEPHTHQPHAALATCSGKKSQLLRQLHTGCMPIHGHEGQARQIKEECHNLKQSKSTSVPVVRFTC